MPYVLSHRSALLATAALASVMLFQPVHAFAEGHGGGHGGGGGFGGMGGGHGRGQLHLPRGGTGGFGGQNGGYGYGGYGSRGYGSYGYAIGGARGYRPGFGYGQNGDTLSDYAPYGRPVDGCDPTTPSRAHPGCAYGVPFR